MRGSAGFPCLCYVVKKNHPWNPEWIEVSPGKEKLEAFKNKVGGLVRTEFTTGDNLAAGVVADLSREKGKSGAGHEKPAARQKREKPRRGAATKHAPTAAWWPNSNAA